MGPRRGGVHSLRAMERRRKTSGRFVVLAAAWMLAAQVLALDGSDKVPTLPVAGTVAALNASP